MADNSNDLVQQYENINGFSEQLILKLINYTFNNNFNFINNEIEILNSNRKINEINIKSLNKEYLLFLDFVDSDFKSEVCDIMQNKDNYSDEFKHNLLLSINNLVGMAKLVYIQNQEIYTSLLSKFNFTVSPELTIYLDEAIDKRIGIRFIEKKLEK